MSGEEASKHLKGLREVKGVEIGAHTSVDELVTGLRGCAFGAGRLAKAVDIYEAMLNDETTKFMGVSGALVPAGMRSVLSGLIRDRYVDVVVTTGANLVHDIIEALGEHHYLGGDVEVSTGEAVDDVRLRKQGIDRIYDVMVHDEAFARLEEFLRGVFGQLEPRRYSIRELLTAIGRELPDRNSILRSAVDNDIPLFCPALADSMIGLHAWLYKQAGSLEVDAFDDMKELIDLFSEAKRAGAIILGGGVPKNFIFQSALIAPRAEGQEGLDYAIVGQDRRDREGGYALLRCHYCIAATSGCGARTNGTTHEIMRIPAFCMCILFFGCRSLRRSNG
jgi:deoxyhypusine synthase